jgi:hypothetical protein
VPPDNMFSLTDQQLHLLQEAGELFWPSTRSAFLKSVANICADRPKPLSDADLQSAILFVCQSVGVSIGSPEVLLTKKRVANG